MEGDFNGFLVNIRQELILLFNEINKLGFFKDRKLWTTSELYQFLFEVKYINKSNEKISI